MSEENTEKKAKKLELSTLNKETSEKITRLINQLNDEIPVCISRRDFINWCVERLPEPFSSSDINVALKKFYDPEDHAKQLTLEIRKAKSNGENYEDYSQLFLNLHKKSKPKKAITKDDLPSS